MGRLIQCAFQCDVEPDYLVQGILACLSSKMFAKT